MWETPPASSIRAVRIFTGNHEQETGLDSIRILHHLGYLDFAHRS
jgi:hypothetical protein